MRRMYKHQIHRSSRIIASLWLCGIFIVLAAVRAISATPAAIAAPLTRLTGESVLRAAEGREPEFFGCLREQNIGLIIAHRGGAMPDFPENAVPTMQRSTSLVPVIVETDVQESADGVLFINHDDTFNRTTTGSGKVGAAAWADIAKLSLLDPIGLPTAYHPPRFRDVLDAGKGRFLIVVDVKTSNHDHVMREVSEAGAQGRVIYLGLAREEAKTLLQSQPNAMILLAVGDEADLAREKSGGVLGPNATVFVSPQQWDQGMIDGIHSAGASVISVSYSGALFWGGQESPDALYTSLKDAPAYLSMVHRGANLIFSNRPVEAAGALLSDPEYTRRLMRCLRRP
jgi:glycerophosphoryl diester phosphodiesterase